MRRRPVDKVLNEHGQLKSEDPTEGSIFGRINVETRTLINKMRTKSYEKVSSVSTVNSLETVNIK